MFLQCSLHHPHGFIISQHIPQTISGQYEEEVLLGVDHVGGDLRGRSDIRGCIRRRDVSSSTAITTTVGAAIEFWLGGAGGGGGGVMLVVVVVEVLLLLLVVVVVGGGCFLPEYFK